MPTRSEPVNARRNRGFSLLELTIVVGIVAALFYVALDKLLALAVEAERVSVLQMEGSLQSSLGIQVSFRLAKGAPLSELAAMQGMNPMELLSNRPANYVGALDDPDPASIDGGHWYFDTRRQVLVYRVNHDSYVTDSLGPPVRIEYQIKVERDSDSQSGQITGVTLVTLTPYTWHTVPFNPLEYKNLH